MSIDVQGGINSVNQLQKKALNFELLILKQNNEFDGLAQRLHTEQMNLLKEKEL